MDSNAAPQAEEPTPEPTVEMVCLSASDGEGGQVQKCFPKPTPLPTPKYPELWRYSLFVQEMEEKEKANKAAGIAAQVVATNVFVDITMREGHTTKNIRQWLIDNNVPIATNPVKSLKNDTPAIVSYDDHSMIALIPADCCSRSAKSRASAGITTHACSGCVMWRHLSQPKPGSPKDYGK